MKAPLYFQKFIKDVKIVLANSIVDTIAKLKDHLPVESSKFNDLILIEARLNENNLKKIRGTIGNAELELSYNLIREDLLNFVNQLSENDFMTNKSVPSSKNGSLLFKVPKKMKITEEAVCVVRLAYNELKIIENIELTLETVIEPVRVSKIMHVNLIDPGQQENFAIRSYHESEQFVDNDDYTEWKFYIRPLREGILPLILKVSVVEVINNKERLKNLVFEKNISVSTNLEENDTVNSKHGEEAYGFTQFSYFNSGDIQEKKTLTAYLGNSQSTKRWFSVMASLLLVSSFVLGIPYSIQLLEWNRVIEKDNLSSYKAYVEKYPNGWFKKNAIRAIDALDGQSSTLEIFDSSILPNNELEEPADEMNKERLRIEDNSLEVEQRVEDKAPVEVGNEIKLEEPNSGSIDDTAGINFNDEAKLIETRRIKTYDEIKPDRVFPNNGSAKEIVGKLLSDNRRRGILDSNKIISVIKTPEINEKVPTEEFSTGWWIDDRDGQTYLTVLIKDKIWMAQNMNFVTPESWCYMDDSNKCLENGRLYSYRAARVACPKDKGWRLPNDEEWNELALYLGGYSEKGFRKKNPDLAYKKIVKGGESNFNGVFSGMRDRHGKFSAFGSVGAFWTSTPSSQGAAYNYFITSDSKKLFRDNVSYRASGLSCRCIKVE